MSGNPKASATVAIDIVNSPCSMLGYHNLFSIPLFHIVKLVMDGVHGHAQVRRVWNWNSVDSWSMLLNVIKAYPIQNKYSLVWGLYWH